MQASFDAQPNGADWTDYVEVLDDDTGTAWDLSDTLIEMEVTDQLQRRLLYGSTADGKIALAADGFEFSFPSTLMRDIRAGSYMVFVRFTDASSGTVAEPIIANLPVIEGGYR